MTEPPIHGVSPIATLRSRLDTLLAEKDRQSAVSVALNAVRSGDIGPAELYTQVLTPLLIDTGSKWQSGVVDVWEEHFTSATIRTIIEALAPIVAEKASAVPRLGTRVVLACPPGEQHDMGLRMLADRFALAGWDAYFLGADTPADQIARAARQLDAELLVLSAATHYNRVLIREVLALLRRELPGVRIGVGGPAFSAGDLCCDAELLDAAALGLPGEPEREA